MPLCREREGVREEVRVSFAFSPVFGELVVAAAVKLVREGAG